MQKIKRVCRECGVTANILTCLKKYGRPPTKLAYSISTYMTGENSYCDYCEQQKDTTQARDFFYPDFSLIDDVLACFETLELRGIYKTEKAENEE